jgi:hypothetical protein
MWGGFMRGMCMRRVYAGNVYERRVYAGNVYERRFHAGNVYVGRVHAVTSNTLLMPSSPPSLRGCIRKNTKLSVK